MSNTMDLIATDLAHLPGAPFTDDEVDAAVETIQSAAQWAIALEQDDTVVLDVADNESRLHLPTRHLVSVDEIRDTDDDSIIDPSLYRVSTELGWVEYRSGYWPSGYGRIEVDMTHGYDAVPADLLPVIAVVIASNRRVHSIEQVNPDLFFGAAGVLTDNPLATGGVLERYSLGWRVGMA